MAHSGLELSPSVPQGFAQLLSEKGAYVTRLPSCYIVTLSILLNWPLRGHPLSVCAGLHPIQGGANKPLNAFPRIHVAQC